MATPKTVVTAFDEFDNALNLDPRERAKAVDRHNEITEVLKAAGIAASTFLQGSFARKTMPKPLKDVDLIVILPEVLRPRWFGTGKGGPLAAMNAIETAVAARWPDARFDEDKASAHALQVAFEDCAFTVDLVPAFEDLGHGEDVFIADRDFDRWERSNTRTLRRLVADRNQATGGLLVHQVRMGKSFKSSKPTLEKVCGLVIESLCFQAITTRQAHASALVAFFEYSAQAVYGRVMDPTGVDDLAEGWTPSARAAYSQVFTKAARQGREALALATDGHHSAAIEIWHAVLGDLFPEPSAQTAAEALAALAGGSITSTGRAVTSMRGSQVNRPARSWRTR